MSHQRVMLIRSRSGTCAARQALELARRWAQAPASSLVFFQGPGLEHVVPGEVSEFAALAASGLDLRVCRSGWQRLEKGSLPAPFTAGSLVQFWSAALEAVEVESFGAGSNG
ncbi:hypothetical protein [Wenzhouxiangella limi]|uniref:DsrE family protein n=1 Tax=Wenzhouxiangella limi TaxID=2707351 RepID=A0A845V383_9GAMM|nr:hypothetical protein [Wenzhouxiangella limi]NDY96730.1 hypothetical protein [Wenzhouxiangella limi]